MLQDTPMIGKKHRRQKRRLLRLKPHWRNLKIKSDRWMMGSIIIRKSLKRLLGSNYYPRYSSMTPEIERIALWFTWTANISHLPEFGQYRDLIFITKMLVESSLEKENNKIFTPNKVWFTRQLCPRSKAQTTLKPTLTLLSLSTTSL